MKAIIQSRYGSTDVLRLADIEKPVAGADEVLVQVRAASVHPDVWHVMTGLPYVLRLMGAGWLRPKNPVPGTDVAGVVESVGDQVTRFRPGDEVFGETLRGMQWVNGGAFAEYVSAPEDALAPKPKNVTFEEAAAVPTAGLIALLALRGGKRVAPGRKVLVNGAGGGVGSITVQLAKAFGATVTGVDSTAKLDMIRSLGADHVIDYTREDFTQGEARYDLIVDIPGNHALADCVRALNPEGKYTLIGHDAYGRGMRRWVGLIPRMFKLMAMSRFVNYLGDDIAVPERRESMTVLQELLAAGKLMPFIDRTYELSEVPAALTYLESGQARGKVVITV